MKAQNMEKEAEALRDRAEKDAKHEIERARMEAAELVQKTRREAQSLLDELEDLRRNKQKLLTAEQKARLKAGIRDMEKASDPVHERRIDEDYVLPRPLQIGDTVLIYDIDKIATVLDVPKNGDQILVQAGIIKTRVPLKNLRLRLKKNILISCITHHGNTVIPDGESYYQLGDTVIVVTTREQPVLQFNDIFV